MRNINVSGGDWRYVMMVVGDHGCGPSGRRLSLKNLLLSLTSTYPSIAPALLYCIDEKRGLTFEVALDVPITQLTWLDSQR